ncbi:DDE superfamily endonuclease, partial [Rhizoctonia solani AG-3 Rhs1AP]
MKLRARCRQWDGGIIASFKAQYKRRFVRLALERNNQGIEDMYKIDQLQAMYLAKAAWEAVTPQTIANCWRHVGLVPQFHDPPPVPPAPNTSLPAVYPVYPVHHPYVHPLPPPPVPPEAIAPALPYPTHYDYEQYPPLNPEAEQVFDQLNLELATEGVWTDQEIVTQIFQERQDGFTAEEEEEYDLEDFYNYHNPHI